MNNIATPQVDSQQVSVALFSKLSGSKIYGLNRTITSRFIPDPNTITTTNDCRVPDLKLDPDLTATPQKTPAQIITRDNLLENGINLEGGTTVLSQNPLPGSKLPCGKGLVTYTY